MDNALYYEKHFHDIVLDQDDQYFEKDLGETLREFADYKKEHFPLCSEEVTKTKEIMIGGGQAPTLIFFFVCR